MGKALPYFSKLRRYLSVVRTAFRALNSKAPRCPSGDEVITNSEMVDLDASNTGTIVMPEQRENAKKIWKLVLTGGPCGGKTTGQARLSTFFENLGWKVYRSPEIATVLLSGGVNFAELNEEAAIKFQENLLKTMLQTENAFFDLAEASSRNCLIICDRGAMD